MNSCLLIIDAQNGFVSTQTRDTLEKIKILLGKRMFDFVAASKFVNTANSRYVRRMNWHNLSGPPETDLALSVSEIDIVFEKTAYSAVTAEFLTFVKEHCVDTVYLAGFDTDCCVLKTASDFFEADIDAVVLADYTASNGGKESREAAIAVMKRMLGPDSVVSGEPEPFLRPKYSFTGWEWTHRLQCTGQTP